MNQNINNGNSRMWVVNRKINEEAKNKDIANGYNHVLKRNFKKFHHQKNFLSMNDKDLFQHREKVEEVILNNQKNERNIPITLNKVKNVDLPFSINLNNNKIQNNNNIKNKSSIIYEK